MDFVLIVKNWTSSILSTGRFRVHGSLQNQSTCVLFNWRRHSAMGCSAGMGPC